MKIDGKTCIVTGAGNGLGRAIALDLANRGARVQAADINEEALTSLRQENKEAIEPRVLDVRDEESVQTFFAALDKSGITPDILVNNAGITRDGLLIKVGKDATTTMSLDDFMSVLQVNLVGVFLCTREAVKRMVSARGGVIVNISSVSRAGNVGQTNYSASKAGVDAMTVAWSKELARYNIRCAAIAPGYTGTEMVKAVNPQILEKIVARVPLKRLGEPSEISRTVQFIIENDFVNGKILEIDGGLRI